MTTPSPTPVSDLRFILEKTDFRRLKGSTVFLTGASGFFGTWLLESLFFANQQLSLGCKVIAVSRNPAPFLKRFPHLGENGFLDFIQGDLNDLVLPKELRSDFVVHAASETLGGDLPEGSSITPESMVQATKKILDFAENSGARRMLFISSGAVYGRQSPDVPLLSEDSPIQPARDLGKEIYGTGKYLSEQLAERYHHEKGLSFSSARCFAFMGPHLDLNAAFAASSFIRNARAGGPIRISGDGTALRSYLYMSDLMIWLWTVLLQGGSASRYNVGSDVPVSIKDLAVKIAAQFGKGIPVEISGKTSPGVLPERYVPSIKKARQELSLKVWNSLDQTVEKTCAWYSK